MPLAKKIVKYYLPPFVWLAIIFLFSSIPTVTTSKFYLWDFLFKKTAHFIEYFILSTLLYRALVNSKVNKKKSMLLAVLISVVYAISDEYHQSFVPGRGPALRDVVIDSFGAIFAIYFVINNIVKLPRFILNFYQKLEIV